MRKLIQWTMKISWFVTKWKLFFDLILPLMSRRRRKKSRRCLRRLFR